MIRGTCPHCGRIYTVDAQFVGKTGQCRVCGASITVPSQPVASGGGLAAVPSPSEPAPLITTPVAAPAPSSLQSVLTGAQGTPAPADTAAIDEDDEAQPVVPIEHIGRLSFEPEQGPTALHGSWLREDFASAPAGPQDAAAAQRGRDVLSGRFAAPLDELPDEARRPAVIVLAGLWLLLLGLAFAGLLAVFGGHWGIVVASLSACLAALGFIRLWSGHMDALVPALLHCLCVAATVLLLAFGGADSPGLGIPGIALLAAAGLAALFLVLAATSSRGYLYLHRHS